jgi:hypothetical protein
VSVLHVLKIPEIVREVWEHKDFLIRMKALQNLFRNVVITLRSICTYISGPLAKKENLSQNAGCTFPNNNRW